VRRRQTKWVRDRKKRSLERETDRPTYANGLRRIAAIFYDSILLTGILFVATAFLLTLNHGEAFQPGNLIYSAVLILISATFFTWFWTHGGQTLGMRAWKIRLEKADGTPCDAKTALSHWIIGVILGSLMGLGWWFALIDRKGRALQDVICRTRVLRTD
jgi:uncharacterized RDD family membrane protein YckC